MSATSLAAYLSLPAPPPVNVPHSNKNNEPIQWSPSVSAALYRIDRWGPPYFIVNDSGNITVKPFGDSTLPHQEINLFQVVKKVSDPKTLGGVGLPLPLIVRFPDVLKHRLESLQSAFELAVRSNGYGSYYQGVYPVKCNHDRYIVEDIVKFGTRFRFGLEVGSKPELLLAMSCLCKGNPDALLVCNGFKDAEYISLAIIARKLHLNTVIVLEQGEDLDLVIDLTKKMGIRPVVGVRAKLCTRLNSHFGSTSTKYGLTTTQILRVVRKLDSVGMIDCLQLLHFHIGSQIPSTTMLSEIVSEGAQVYCELVRLGAHMRVIDIGGGLGIDYDGSKSTDPESSVTSVGYSLEEYASAVVRSIQDVCDRKGVKNPVICSESGRAIVSHHSVLVFEADSLAEETASNSSSSTLSLDYLVDGLSDEGRGIYQKLRGAATRGEYASCLMYGDQLKQKCIDEFKKGSSGMEQLAAVEGLCELVSKSLGVTDAVTNYYINLSVFTSIPDFLGMEQLYPIMPIHRLGEQPKMRGILSDLTCDCDGKIDRFIGGESSLPLHESRCKTGGDGGYYLGMFLAGAYEEAVGGIHNLFAAPSIARVLQSDGPPGFDVTQVKPGPSNGNVLRMMQYEPHLMFQALKHRAEECLCNDQDHHYTATSLANGFARSFNNMPYLTPSPTVSSFCSFINNNVNGFVDDDSCNASAVEVATAEDEQLSYVCA